MKNDQRNFFSLVIPIFNEQENLQELCQRFTRVMEGLNKSYEIIFVDDGSSDYSFQTLQNLHQKDRQIRVIRFSRNFGHHIAITAGLDHAQGQTIVLMDGDLQDAPEDIPKLYAKFKQGYDIVYATRQTRKDPFFKKLNSKIFYQVLKLIGNISIPTDVGIFRIMSHRAAHALSRCREQSRFIVGLMDWTGFSSVGVAIERQPRYQGKPKYNFFKSLKLAINAITSFSHFPLKLATYIGFLMALVSSVLAVYIVIKKLFFNVSTSGYTSIIVSILFLGSIQLIIMGIIGAYIGRIYTEAQNRPLYIIKEKIGLD